MTFPSWLRLVAVLFAALLFQVCVLDEIIVSGTHPDAMVVLVAAAGVVGGPVRGAMVGFAAGLMADLAVRLPFGLSALSFTLVGFGVSFLSTAAAGRDLPGARNALVLCGALGGTLLYGLIGAILDQPGMVSEALTRALLVVGLGAIILGSPALWVLRWVLTPSAGPSGLAVPHGGSASA